MYIGAMAAGLPHISEEARMRRPACAMALIAVMLLSGCGAGSSPGTSSSVTSGSQSESAAPTAPPSADSSETESAAANSVEPTPSADPEQEALRSAAQKYSDAYLTGDAKTAYSILSTRCQDRLSKAEFAAMVDLAESMYGSALPFESFSAKISDEFARVTYTFSVKAINQTKEPWVKEGGSWREDDC